MTAYVAPLRAVNVGGTGKLPMKDLRTLCESLGFENVRTYIASGNVVFDSHAEQATVKRELERALAEYAGKPVGVFVRTGAELSELLKRNPFRTAAPNRTVAVFLDAPPPTDLMSGVSGLADEEIAPGLQEIYIHYGHGMASSKLRVAAARSGTARNINTIAKLAQLAAS